MSKSENELITNGISEMKSGNYDRAEQLFNNAIALAGPNQHKAFYNKGLLFHKYANMKQLAIPCYRRATSLQPDYGYAWNNLGDVLCNLNQYEEAKEVFQKAIDALPGEAPPKVGLAYAQNRLGAFSNAIETLQPLLEKDNTEQELLGKIYSELGLAFLSTNRGANANDYFRKAFELNEKDYQACYNIAFIADAFQNYKEALLFYDKAIAINVNESKGYQGKACTLIHMKRYKEALTPMKKAIVLNPTNFEGYYNLACIHAGMGEEGQLLDAIRKTTELAPPHIGIEQHMLNDPDFLPYVKKKEFAEILNRNQ